MREIFLDPDGTQSPWLYVVVQAPTGVVYSTQCAGTGCEIRKVEGFLVPANGPKVDLDDGRLSSDEFTEIFHDGKACIWSWVGTALPADRMETLRALVESVPYWTTEDDDPSEKRLSLQVDTSRIEEIAEAWVPVLTPHGPGVLLWDNCD